MARSMASIGIRPGRLAAGLALAAAALGSSGFSSCAGSTGPLVTPAFEIVPEEVLLRASVASGRKAVGLARIEGDGSERYRVTVEYDRGGAGWLQVDPAGRDLRLEADPAGLAQGIHLARVVVEGDRSGSTASLRVEFSVIP